MSSSDTRTQRSQQPLRLSRSRCVILAFVACMCQPAYASRNITAVSYSIFIDLKLSGTSQFDGYVNLTFIPKEPYPFKKIELDAVRLWMTEKIQLFDLHYLNPVELADVSHGVNTTVITTKYNLIPSRQYQLSMKYRGYIDVKGQGLFRNDYKERHFLVTNLASGYASNFLPCVDRTTDKANISLVVIHHRTSRVISITPLKTSVVVDKSYMEATFEVARNIPLNMFAFVVGEFEELHKNETVALTTYGLPSSKELLRLAHTCASEVIVAGKEMINVTSQSGVNIVVWPDMPVNVIGAGLMILSEETHSFTDGLPARNEQDIVLAMAEYLTTSWSELHLWPKSWAEKWIATGYASFLKFKLPALIRPKWDLNRQQVASQVPSALMLDGYSHLPAFKEMDQQVANSCMPAKKGASFLLMLENLLNETFWRGTRKIFSDSTNHVTSVIDLSDIFENQAMQDKVKSEEITKYTIWNLFRSWSIQPGYPIVSVDRNYDNGTVSFPQERFFTYIEDRENASDYAWWIPLSVMTKKGHWPGAEKPTRWLVQHEVRRFENLAPQDEWIYINVNRAGSFRVTYDNENWIKLISYLKSPYMIDLPVLTRAHLVNDALAVGRGGLLSWPFALNVFAYLSAETEYIPWKAVLPELTFIKDRLRDTPALDLLKQYISKLVRNAFLDSQYNVDAPFVHEKKLLKELMFWWACWAGLPQCENSTRAYFQEWYKDESKLPPAETFTTVMCMGVRNVDDKNAVLSKSRTEEIGPLRNLYLTGLACSRSPQYVLKVLIHGAAKGQNDVFFYSMALLQHSDNVQGLLKVLGTPYYFAMFRDSLRAESNLLTILKVLSTKINTDVELYQLEDIIKTNAPKWKGLLKHSLQIARMNLAWKRKNIAGIEDWLKIALHQ